jgi:copper chaperone CopZ
MRYFLPFIFALSLNAAPNIDPDVEIRIKGLVCPSCAVGLKNAFKKNPYVKGLKIDTKKGTLSLEYWKTEIHPSKIKTMVKKSGYDVSSIKWLKNKKPQRYNSP